MQKITSWDNQVELIAGFKNEGQELRKSNDRYFLILVGYKINESGDILHLSILPASDGLDYSGDEPILIRAFFHRHLLLPVLVLNTNQTMNLH